jgi:hypothetical protein
MLSGWIRQGQAQEASGLIGNVLEVDQAAAFADDIEQVAMLSRGRISPFSSGTVAGQWPGQPNEHGSARCVMNVSHQPVMTLLPAVRQIVPAHRFGVLGKLARKLGGGARHGGLQEGWTQSGARHD